MPCALGQRRQTRNPKVSLYFDETQRMHGYRWRANISKENGKEWAMAFFWLIILATDDKEMNRIGCLQAVEIWANKIFNNFLEDYDTLVRDPDQKVGMHPKDVVKRAQQGSPSYVDEKKKKKKKKKKKTTSDYQALLSDPNTQIRQEYLLFYLWRTVPGVINNLQKPLESELINVYDNLHRFLHSMRSEFALTKRADRYPWIHPIATKFGKEWPLDFFRLAFLLNFGAEEDAEKWRCPRIQCPIWQLGRVNRLSQLPREAVRGRGA
ncbi:hypothetical protein K458DRAFT_393743 [Lentithecium fluviatile CBS 122367]|uniref:Uncharacterized protein n=1 Tax=Lentithecium fluviatile CBS 122367 TaxID=1168545 RepID=A0A6G1INE3_9PLEO|nr:hypothetical protein K458DRAFT_393743 [Lentithecium fluviatile CBS 122367]